MSDGTLIHIPTDPDAPYPLGRSIVWHDPQNRLHRANPLMSLPDRSRTHVTVDVYDQQGSSCTMQSAIGVLRTTPNTRAFKQFRDRYDTEAERHAGYLRAQAYDPWPGGEPSYEGSSTDAPFKLLREEGIISGWKWLFGFHEVKQWVMHHGPVSVGTNWYEGMFYPDSKGVIKPTGQVAGGHAWRIVGFNLKSHQFRLVNSWSRQWGQYGRAWIHEDDLGRLLSEQGEAVTVVT